MPNGPINKKRVMFKSFCFFVLIAILSSCSLDQEKLIGTWKLVETNAAINEETNYLIFTADSVTSIREACLLTEQGTYKIAKKHVEMKFNNGRIVRAKIEFEDGKLIVQSELNDYISGYEKVKTIPVYQSNRENLGHPDFTCCYENCIWEYSGKKMKRTIYSNVNSKDTFIIPPKMIDLRREHNPRFRYDHIFLLNAIPNSTMAFAIEKYTGNELYLVPRSSTWFVEEKDSYFSDTAFIYRRSYP